jgi:hypothetical protein
VDRHKRLGAPVDHRRAIPHIGPKDLASLGRATTWLNSAPLTADGLRGRVVLVDFWTYTCINWLRTLPHVRAWAARYKEYGLVALGGHTPESVGPERRVDGQGRSRHPERCRRTDRVPVSRRVICTSF